MERIVRIGNIDQQDRFRREDCAKMSPQERVNSLLQMQANFLRWDCNSKIERVGKLKRINFQNVT